MSGKRRLVAVGVCFTLMAGGCGDTPTPSDRSSDPVAATTDTSVPPGAFTPTFDERPCPDDVAIVVVRPPTCGDLTVLEDRDKPNGRTIKIFVVRTDPPDGVEAAPDPRVVFGGALAARVDYGGVAGFPQRAGRVNYIVDVRGTGHSNPSLDCPELNAIGPRLAGLRLTDELHRSTLLTAVRACRDRLVAAGIDLAAYDLANIAQDVEDLRTVLGIESWNIQGNGSANLIAFEVASRYPRGIRSLTADSPNLLAPDQFTWGLAGLDVAIDRLASACAEQADCAASIPDLRASFEAVVAKLDTSPVTIERPSPDGAAATKIVIDGAGFLRWARAMIGDDGGRGIPAMMAMLANADDGRIDPDDPIVESLASDPAACLGIVAQCRYVVAGALYSIVCRDILPRVDRAALDAAVDGRSPAYRALFDPGPVLLACDAWGVEAADPEPFQAPSVPALLLRGAIDPFTAPLEGLVDATRGTSAEVLEVPFQSHNALGYLECPRTVFLTWLDAPSDGLPATDCLREIRPPELLPGI